MRTYFDMLERGANTIVLDIKDIWSGKAQKMIDEAKKDTSS